MIGLHEDVAEMFSRLEGCFESSEEVDAGERGLSLPHGFHVAGNHSWLKTAEPRTVFETDAARTARKRETDARSWPARRERRKAKSVARAA